MTRPSWNDFSRKQAAEPKVTTPGEESDDDIVAAILSGPRGRDFLRVLYGLTIDKRCRPGATEAELREAEAKRHLVQTLEAMRDRGLEAKRAAQKP